jgi:hypothetical protein
VTVILMFCSLVTTGVSFYIRMRFPSEQGIAAVAVVVAIAFFLAAIASAAFR